MVFACPAPSLSGRMATLHPVPEPYPQSMTTFAAIMKTADFSRFLFVYVGVMSIWVSLRGDFPSVCSVFDNRSDREISSLTIIQHTNRPAQTAALTSSNPMGGGR